MTPTVLEEPHAAQGSVSSHSRVCPRLLAVGTAVPALRQSQQQAAARLAHVWKLRGDALERWHRIVDGSGIEWRHGVVEPEIVAPLSTAQRMELFEQHASSIAVDAASRAMASAGLDPRRITDLVVVTCTGFAAPGLDVALIDRLGLSAATRRTMIGFMGCFGAVNGLRIASSICSADPSAVALLVCVELCSLHMRLEDSPQNQVASALFADGAAAAVLAGSDHPIGVHQSETQPPLIGAMGASASRLLAEGRDWMSWRITDTGFAMTLTRQVPAALRQNIGAFVQELAGDSQDPVIVHPGGPGIVDAVDTALQLDGGFGIECSRSILRDFGNMSSASVLFVLSRALTMGHQPPMTLLAFGPGVTIEGIRIEPVRPRA